DRARHRGRHRSRIAAGKARLNLERRKIDGWKIADRKRAVRDDAKQRDRRHQEAGGDGPLDEDFRDVHEETWCRPSRLQVAGLTTCTTSGLHLARAAAVASASAAASAASTATSARGAAAVADLNPAAGFEPKLPFGDDRLSALQ